MESIQLYVCFERQNSAKPNLINHPYDKNLQILFLNNGKQQYKQTVHISLPQFSDY